MSLLSRLFLGVTSLWAVNAQAQEVEPTDYQTYTYFDSSRVKLALDLFLPELETDTLTPLVIFLHGGGFAGGERAHGHDLGRYLRTRGVATASISYTLYMQGKDFSCGGVTSEKVKAIQLAASELWQATAFILNRTEEWSIDSAQIFIAGSSAGGEAVLHAAFWDRSIMQYYHQALPPDFRYAGVISGAGAIMDINLIDTESQIPVFAFHGDEDPLVPYRTAAHHYCPPNSTGWLMFFGSETICRQLQALDGIAQLVTFRGGGHEYAGYFFNREQHRIYSFIERVLSGERFVEFRVGKNY